VLLVVIQVAAARLRAMAREQAATARSLELMESKNRALESFAARAAHDLRSPLVPIHSLASLIIRAGRDEGDVRLASRIVGSASRMSWSRCGSPRTATDPEGILDTPALPVRERPTLGTGT